MTSAHAAHPALSPLALLTVLPVLVAALCYGAGLARLRRRGVRWPWVRTALAVAGLAVLAAALLPPLAAHDEEFTAHVAQHLLLTSAAPLLLALSAPATLALRALPVGGRRRLLTVLRSGPVGVLSAPLPAGVLVGASTWLLYGTPLYAWALDRPWLHVLVHAHMLLAGCLLAWSLVGTDPLPHRARVPVRLAVLVAVAAVHDVLARAVYAQGLPGVGEDVQPGALLLYYGGDAAEVLLAVVLLGQWYAGGGRELARAQRRLVASAGQAGSGGRAFCG